MLIFGQILLILSIMVLSFFLLRKIIKEGFIGMSFWCIHIGLLIVILFGLINSFKGMSFKMKVYQSVENNMAFSSKGYTTQLPYTLELINIKSEKNKIGNTYRSTAHLILTENKVRSDFKIKVNKPYSFSNSDIYLAEIPDDNDVSCSLLIVYNPFKWCILIGIFIVLFGCLKALSVLKRHGGNYGNQAYNDSVIRKWVLPSAIILSILLSVMYIFVPHFFVTELSVRTNILSKLSDICFLVSLSFLIITSFFSILEVLREKSDCIVRDNDSLRIGVIILIISILLRMMWSKNANGFFIVSEIEIVWMLMISIIYSIALHIRERNTRLAIVLLVVGVFIVLVGIVGFYLKYNY